MPPKRRRSVPQAKASVPDSHSHVASPPLYNVVPQRNLAEPPPLPADVPASQPDDPIANPRKKSVRFSQSQDEPQEEIGEESILLQVRSLLNSLSHDARARVLERLNEDYASGSSLSTEASFSAQKARPVLKRASNTTLVHADPTTGEALIGSSKQGQHLQQEEQYAVPSVRAPRLLHGLADSSVSNDDGQKGVVSVRNGADSVATMRAPDVDKLTTLLTYVPKMVLDVLLPQQRRRGLSAFSGIGKSQCSLQAGFDSSLAFSNPSQSQSGDDVDSNSDSDDDRPVCKYGLNCYRKSQAHLKQFSHPWKQRPTTVPTSLKGNPPINESEAPSDSHAAAAAATAATAPTNDSRAASNARMDTFPAAVLFVDISGFTSLNELFAKSGSAGIENVAKHINGYFSQLIAMITEHGGDVMKFAGDALIVAFGSPTRAVALGADSGDEAAVTEMLRLCTLEAVQCGIAIQTELKSYSAPVLAERGLELTLHIGISSGMLSALHLGGIDGVWEFFPVSRLLFKQIEGPVEKSKTGEVCVAAAAWKFIEECCDGEDRDGDILVLKVRSPTKKQPLQRTTHDALQALLGVQEHSLDTGSVLHTPSKARARYSSEDEARSALESLVRGYIGKGIQGRIDAGQSRYLAEFRRVTVIFVNMSGFSFQKEGTSGEVDPQELNNVLCSMQRVILRHSGFLRQFLVDDKGCTLIAVFGVPPYAHEDDCVRGIGVAMEAWKKLLLLGIHSTIGVTTGLAFCGSVGSDTRREYAVVGDVVNLSARLMVNVKKVLPGVVQDTASPPILCDQATYEGSCLDESGQASAAGGFRVRFNTTLTPIMVKGKSQPIEIYQPLERVHSRSGDMWEQGTFLRATSMAVIQSARRRLDKDAVPICGRKEEVQTLAELIETLGSNTPGCGLLIEGNAGIGKSKLADELVHLTDIRFRGKCYQGRCDFLERDTAAHAFYDVVKQLLRLTRGNPDLNMSIVKSHAEQIKDPAAREKCIGLLPTLNMLWFANNEEDDRRMAGDRSRPPATSDQRDAIAFVIVKLFEVVCLQNPRVVIIEDAQWLDETSWRILLDIAPINGLLVCVVARTFGARAGGISSGNSAQSSPTSVSSALSVPPQLFEFLQSSHTRHIRLGALPDVDIVAMLKLIWRTRDAPEAVSRWICTTSRGNPLYVRELAAMMIGQQVIELESLAAPVFDGNGTQCDNRVNELRDVATLGSSVPRTLEGLIISHIDSMAPAPAMVLKIGAVLGQRLPFNIVVHVFSVECHSKPPAEQPAAVLAQIRREVDNSMTTLREAGLLMLVPSQDPHQASNHQFVSTMYQEVVYNAMTFEQRKILHSAVAVYYESHYIMDAGDKRRYLLPMIFHFGRAEDDAKSQKYHAELQQRHRYNSAAQITRTATLINAGANQLKRSMSAWMSTAERDQTVIEPVQKRGRL